MRREKKLRKCLRKEGLSVLEKGKFQEKNKSKLRELLKLLAKREKRSLKKFFKKFEEEKNFAKAKT